MIPINSQPIEKRATGDGSTLEVHSIFYTIQGEGPFTGHPAVFIRLAGCNLQCPSCDTDYTSKRSHLSIGDVINRVVSCYSSKKLPLIVVTGGEPFRQNIAQLVKKLIDFNFKIQIETNGSLAFLQDFPLAYNDITIVCSPKTGKINSDIREWVKAYKYVLSHDSVDPEDGLPLLALNHTASPRVARPPKHFNGPIYLQPMDAQDPKINKLNIEAVKQSCLKFGYIFQLQTHKIIGVE